MLGTFVKFFGYCSQQINPNMPDSGCKFYLDETLCSEIRTDITLPCHRTQTGVMYSMCKSGLTVPIN